MEKSSFLYQDVAISGGVKIFYPPMKLAVHAVNILSTNEVAYSYEKKELNMGKLFQIASCILQDFRFICIEERVSDQLNPRIY